MTALVTHMTQKVYHRSGRDDWETPPDLFAAVERRFGRFDLDPAASHDNAKAPHYFTVEDDGLAQRWYGQVWLNPPYSQTAQWTFKCIAECADRNVRRIVLLVAARTDTRWFHELIASGHVEEVLALRGRLRFVGAESVAPFPSLIVVMSPLPLFVRSRRLLFEVWDWRNGS